MIKTTNRKDKIDTLKGLLNGTKTVKDLRQGQVKLLEYAACNEVPGVLYDRQGSPCSEAEMKAKYEKQQAGGFLVWNETRTYNTKSELHGFIAQPKG